MENSSYVKKKESREKSKREFDDGSVAFFLKLVQKPLLRVHLGSTNSTESHHLSSLVVLWVVDTLHLRQYMTIVEEDIDKNANSSEDTDTISCHPPFVYLKDSNYTICGLSSILRFILKFVSTKLLKEDQEKPKDEGVFLESLMGFRGGCLQACKEVSVWTKFCEDEVLSLFSLKNDENETIPETLQKFENHLASPVRLFNAMKLSESPAHIFAEGPEINLSDLILYPAISSSVEKIGENKFSERLPRIWTWLKRLQVKLGLKASKEVCFTIGIGSSLEPNFEKDSPSSEVSSLYKKDPSRDKKGHDKNKFFTRQKDVDIALLAIDRLELGHSFSPVLEVDSIVNWKMLPDEVNPCGGFLPEGRKDRKGLQVGAMALQVRRVVEELKAKNNLTYPARVVDFCAGGGHVGLLVAALLKNHVHVILVENKAESLRRASERVSSIGLSNVSLVESNLDYFIGNFDVGVALHACGSATDLVLLKCISQCASFVVSPCCYGAVTNQPPVLSYPRSKAFRRSQVNLDSYLTLAHTADQTHGKDNAKSNQGQRAMIAIDSDRLMNAMDHNESSVKGSYSCSLVRMPEEASPKNHILVGRFVKSEII